jgi:hypothetical protein
MDEVELHKAMRPASANPEDERDKNDLGRFGLGLKTASLSQARCLTVVTSAGSLLTGARWDLDNIKNWAMAVFSEAECHALLNTPPSGSSMTEVIWTKLDRLTEGGTLNEDLFASLINGARREIALIFHRYIAAGRGNKSLKIILNGLELPAYDPFRTDCAPISEELQTETLEVEGGKIIITPFILPHYSRLNSGEFEALAGEEGYLRNQGFYVYRNRRLIIHGTWFKLVRHGDLSKLARVRIDIPNTLDARWKITVDKSDAQIPSVLKARLKSLIERIRDSSARVYRGRGARLGRADTVSVWSRTITRDGIIYNINKEHPIIDQFVKNIGKNNKGALDEIFSLIGQNFPFDTVHADMSDRPNEMSLTYTDPDSIIRLSLNFATKFMNDGGTKDALLKILEETEPFKANISLIKEHFLANGVIND